MDNKSEEPIEYDRDFSNMLLIIGIVLLFRGLLQWLAASKHAWFFSVDPLVLACMTVGPLVVSVVVDIALDRKSGGKRRICVGSLLLLWDVVALGRELSDPSTSWLYSGDPWAPFLRTLGGSILFIISGLLLLKGQQRKTEK